MRLPELDGYRGIAIAAVLALHASHEVLRGGFLGVDLFFVISGFIITRLLMLEQAATGHVSIAGFYARRALRILPPLAAAVALAVAVSPWAGMPPLAPPLLFYANFAFDGLGSLAHTWSLSIEEQFYALWPLAFLALGRARLPVMAALIVLPGAFRLAMVLHGAPETMLGWTPARIDGLAAGCAAALLGDRWRAAPRWAAPVAFAIVVACLLAASRHSAAFITGGLTAFVLAAAVAIAAPASAPMHRWLTSRPLQYLGKRSYGLYIYHWPIFYAIERARVPGNLGSAVVALVAEIALTFLAAEVSYRTLERFAAALKGRFSRQHADPRSGDAHAPRRADQQREVLRENAHG